MGGMTSCEAEPLPPPTCQVDLNRSMPESVVGLRQFELHLTEQGTVSCEPREIPLDGMFSADTKVYSLDYQYLVRRVQIIGRGNETNRDATVVFRVKLHGEDVTRDYAYVIPALASYSESIKPHVLYVHPFFERDELRYLPAVREELLAPQDIQRVRTTKDLLLRSDSTAYMWYLMQLPDFRKHLDLTQKTLPDTTQPRVYQPPDGLLSGPPRVVVPESTFEAFVEYLRVAWFDRIRYVNAEDSALLMLDVGTLPKDEYARCVQRKYMGKRLGELQSHCLCARVKYLVEYYRVPKSPPLERLPLVPIMCGNVSASSSALFQAKTHPFVSDLEMYRYEPPSVKAKGKTKKEVVAVPVKSMFPDEKVEEKPMELGEGVNPFTAVEVKGEGGQDGAKK